MEQNNLGVFNIDWNDLAAIIHYFGEPLTDLADDPILPVGELVVESQATQTFIPNDPNPLFPQVTTVGHGQQNVYSGQQCVQQVATGSANEVPTNRNRADLPESLSIGTSTEGTGRLLNMNPKRKVTKKQQNQNWRLEIGARLRNQPPRRGRPPKRREGGNQSSQHGKKVSSEKVSTGTTASCQQPQMASYNTVNIHQNATPMPTVHGLYDLQFKSIGLALDPHVRSLYQALGRQPFNV